MKYAVIKIINGNYAVHSEGFTDLNKAKVSYHGFLSALYNDLDGVESFCVMLMNESGMAEEKAQYVAPIPIPEAEEPTND